MEEDAGKLTHDPHSSTTQMDFNRCGIPLIEIVSQPDFRSSGEVLAYLERLRETLLYLGVCDCKLQEGSIRADVNLSIRLEGGELGTRTETKNLNSFKAIKRAIDYETKRQIRVLERGGQIVQETRRWDDDKGVSYGMRSKENAQEYRYFPEPDLLPVSIDDTWLEKIKKDIPELAHQKRERYMRDYNISEFEASVLTGQKNISELFEIVAENSGEPMEAAHLITGEIMRLINQTKMLPEELSLDGRKLSSLIKLVLSGTINRNAYKETVEAVFLHDIDPESYIAEKGLIMLIDDKSITEAVKLVLIENADAVADYRSGKTKVIGFLMGQTMKKMGGTGNPEMAKKVLTDALKKEL